MVQWHPRAQGTARYYFTITIHCILQPLIYMQEYDCRNRWPPEVTDTGGSQPKDIRTTGSMAHLAVTMTL